jgi:hypothetical protein
MNAVATPNTRRALSLAIVLYLLWVFATYLLEGRIHTFLRPEAMGARLFYAVVANLLIGLGGSALVIRTLSRAPCRRSSLGSEDSGTRSLLS